MHGLTWDGVLVGNDGAIGDHSNWTIARNKLTDFGPSSFGTSGYGLELSNTSHGVIEDNIIDSGTGHYPGTGILIYNRRPSNGDILIQRNNIRGQYDFAGIDVQSSTEEVATSTLDNVRILNNDVNITGPASPTVPSLPDTALRIRNKINGTVTGVTISGNSFVKATGYSMTNDTTGSLDVAKNWWGTASSTKIAAKISGGANYTPWYIDAGRASLNTDVSGTSVTVSGNFTPASTATGTVSLPTGTSDLSMSSGSVLDFSTGTSSASGGNITIGGTTQSLSSFSSGDITTANLTAPLAVGSTTVTVAQAVKLSSGTSTPVVITNTALPNVSASIPDGTTILAPSGWKGTIAPPTTVTGSGDAPSGFSVGSSVIEVGSSDAVLLFDKPVTLTLTGVTGPIGYKPAGTTSWTKITTVCGGSYATTTSPTFPGECAISNGTDTKILTYHFTSFGGMTPIAPTISPDSAVFHGSVNVTMSNPSGMPIHYTVDGTTPTCSSTHYTGMLTFNGATILKAVSCDGSDASAVASANFSPSGGGGGGGGSIAATPATPAVPGVSPAVPATPATPAQGKVLGAEAYNFTKDLHMGSSGADVTELQKLLIAEGFDIPAITKGGITYGYFGGQTLSAVIAYQRAHGVSPAKGYVSTLTRAELNKGTTPATPETPAAKGKTNLSVSQVNSILSVLESFGVDQATMDKVKAALGQ